MKKAYRKNKWKWKNLDTGEERGFRCLSELCYYIGYRDMGITYDSLRNHFSKNGIKYKNRLCEVWEVL